MPPSGSRDASLVILGRPKPRFFSSPFALNEVNYLSNTPHLSSRGISSQMAGSDRNDLRGDSAYGFAGYEDDDNDLSSSTRTDHPYRNPDQSKDRDELQRNVDDFIENKKLTGENVNKELLLKGAMILNFEGDCSGEVLKEKAMLKSSDLILLKDEGTWKAQPWELFISVTINCIAAVIQGWDQSGTNGANLFWPRSLIKSCDDQRSSINTYPTISTATQPATPVLASARPCKESFSPCVPVRSLRTITVLTYHGRLIGLVNAAPYIMIAVV